MSKRTEKRKDTEMTSGKTAPFVEGLKVSEVVDVLLEDISLGDSTFQYRLSMNTGDLRPSLVQDGQREPIDLTGSKPYRIIDGFRRAQVAKELGWNGVKALVHRGISEEEAHKLAFIKNVVRKNLSPMDKAHAIYQAEQRGNKPVQLAELMGLSEKQVQRYRALLDFPSEIRKLLDDGTLTMVHAKVLADFGVKSTGEWLKRIKEEGLSGKQLKRAVKKASGGRTPGRPKLYMKKSRNGFRMYPFTISKDASQGEKDKVIKVLQDAIEVLKA